MKHINCFQYLILFFLLNCNLTRRNEGGPPDGRSTVPDNTSPWNKPGFWTAANSAIVAPLKIITFAN